jgi:hypothetical protein
MQNSFNMSKLPNCERDSLKSFIHILRAYGLDYQRESNIGVVENSRSKIEILAYQSKQGGHFRVAKEELQKLKVDQHNLNSRVAIEDLQQLEHQGSNLSAIKEEIGTRDSYMDVEGQLRKLTIDQFYNQKFKKFLC